MNRNPGIHRLITILTACAAVACTLTANAKSAWWDKEWTGKKPLTIDTTAEGGAIKDEVGTVVVLVRLHQGNFPFEAAREDGADVRFVAGDDATPLPFHIEKWDPLMLEGIAWVQVPDVAAEGKTEIFVYYGNPEPAADNGPDPSKTYPETTLLAYNFSERGTPPKDATPNGNTAASAGTISEGSLIGPGMRLLGADPIEIPATPSLEWQAGQDWAWSAWVKGSGPSENAIVLSRSEGDNALRIGINSGIPFVELVKDGSATRTEPGDPVADTAWTRLDVVASEGNIALSVNGKQYSTLSGTLPALNSPFYLGGDAAGSASSNNRFVGEIDEMRMEKSPTSAGAVAFAALNQSGSEASNKLLVHGEGEGGHGGGHNEALEHVMLFGDIANNMMFDGWIAVVVCVIMMIIGWSVAASKFVTLGKIQKGNEAFQTLWREVSTDLTAMDLDDPNAAKSFKGKLGKKALRLLADSPVYHVYHVGVEEIQHRLGKGKNKGQGLSARSIQAIRAALDSSLVHEQHRLNKGIVYLTVSIAGGPYVGLLGTVVGVMITFAIIAKSGEVDVNSIAPGIASALLATTVGLLVAIPALFMYSFLNTRIKASIAAMQVFIDEFVAKVAEFYPPPGETMLPVPIRQIRTPEEAILKQEPPSDEDKKQPAAKATK